MTKPTSINEEVDTIQKLSDAVDKEIAEEQFKKHKGELKEIRVSIKKAEKLIKQLKLEEKDLVARISEGV
jgi:hypothetical protein